MKQLLFVLLGTFIIHCGYGQALNKYGQAANSVAERVNKNGATGTTGLNKNGGEVAAFTPGNGGGNNALAFNGVDNYASVPPDVYFNGDFTIECWVYPKSFGNWARIIDFGNGAGSNNVLLAYSYGTSGAPGFYVEGGQFAANQTIPLNQWTHIAATLSGNTAIIYINGIEAGTATLPAPVNITRNNCYIGKSNWGGDPQADAIFDELRIWNVAKTPAEITAAMNTELAGNESGLVAYYNFNHGVAGGTNTTVTALTDKTNNHNGTLIDFTLTGTESNWVNGAPLLFDGSTELTASGSAYAIKQAYPASQDGYYWIKNASINNGTPFKIYADMTTDGGGWTLIMCNKSPNDGWTNANAILRNETVPTDNDDYSIIAWADYIKKSSTGFQYMIDAETRGNWGGIWTANQSYSFISQDNTNTDITLDTKFGTWDYFEGGGIAQRMPWYTTQTSDGIITTSESGTGYWWGTLISGANWDPSPWISDSMQNPGVIWYWVR